MSNSSIEQDFASDRVDFRIPDGVPVGVYTLADKCDDKHDDWIRAR
jgi:hypothetical protein